MKCLFSYFLCLTFVAFIGAQNIVDSPCPDRPVQENFDIVKYTSGVWYDVLRYEARFSKGCECGFANYFLNADNTVKSRNCCKRLPNATLSCVEGKATLSDADHVPLEAKLNVSFGNRPNTESNYWILSTDYDNYSIVYYCKNLEDNKSSQLAWLLSRQPQVDKLTPAAQATANGLIDAHFDRSKMHQAVQTAEQCDPRDE